MNRFTLIFIGLINLIHLPLAQGAGFTGDFAPSNWTTTISAGNSGSITPNGGTSVTIIGNNNSFSGPMNSYTTTANQAGTLTFSWAYGTNDAPFYDRFIFLNNGIATTITDINAGNSQNGSQSILINKNDVFGFAIDATDGCCGEGFVTISDFLFQLFGPSPIDTQDSMQGNASALRKFFSLQASYNNPGLSYDCSIFDQNGICVSATARNTSVSSSSVEGTSGVVTAAYRINQNVRIGGFIEQLASSVRDGGIRLDNNNPDFGVFGVWQENEEGEGLKLRAAYRYGNKDLEVTRQALGTAEAGFGETELTTQGVQFTLSNGFRVHDKVLLSPYAGLRYIKIKRDGYTEELSSAVTTPLTYDNLTQETTTALIGANLAVQITPQVTALGSVGLEHDTARKIGNYSATGVDNLESIKFGDDSKKTRKVASIGLGYRINQTQHVGAQVFYREEAYGDKSTTTGMLTYTAGF